jgi:hypothetical protein
MLLRFYCVRTPKSTYILKKCHLSYIKISYLKKKKNLPLPRLTAQRSGRLNDRSEQNNNRIGGRMASHNSYYREIFWWRAIEGLNIVLRYRNRFGVLIARPRRDRIDGAPATAPGASLLSLRSTIATFRIVAIVVALKPPFFLF